MTVASDPTIWKTALLDPPWEERGSGKIKRGAQKHYPLLKTKDMPDVIRSSGLWTPGEDAHVYMFVTNTFLPDGLWLLKELGARYITNVAWTKKRPGIGRYFRGKHELLLFATIGRGWAVRTAPNNIESTVDTDDEGYFPDGDSVEAEHEMVNGKRKHSAKPKVFYDMIESRSQGPYAEFFARSLRPGWQTFGNDVALTAPSSIVAATQAALARQREEAGLPAIEPPKKKRVKKAEAPCEHSFMGKPRMCGKCGVRDEPKDVMPIAEMDGADITLNETRAPEPPKHRAYALVDGKVQGEVPNVMFDAKVSHAPLPLTGPGFIAQLEEAFAHVEAAAFDGKPEPEPKLDGMFMTGPLPGGSSRHLPPPQLVPPPGPVKCRHGDVASICILCRARR